MKRSLEIEAFIKGVKKRIAGSILLIIFILGCGTGIGLVGFFFHSMVIVKTGLAILISGGTLTAIYKMSIRIMGLSRQLTGLKGLLTLARFIEHYPELATEQDRKKLELFMLHYTAKLLGVKGDDKIE